ncbi:MAG: hypothetical protein PHO67_05195 [Candidatus Omnitrophica bacterium]|nr:hypothetical protein [Candidatus Omnitrophota bacterium]
MPSKKLKPILDHFHREIDYSLKLVRLVDEVKDAYQPKRGPKLSSKEVQLIAEFSFLNIFIAYEIFMEQAFIRYMMGGETSRGYKPKRYVSPKDEEHARKITLQDFTSYTDWSTPDKIKRRAEYCFKNGEPFKTNIDLYIQMLQDIKTIRNHITHSSIDAKEKFEDKARFYLGTLPPGKELKVGAFLLMRNSRSASVENLNEYFCKQLKDFSKRIIS